MRFNLYTNIKDFYRDTFDTLSRHEAQNLILLGNVIMGNEGKDREDWRDPASWFMATVTEGSGIALTALMTPPFKLTLYASDNIIRDDALDCLAKGILESGVSLPGVMTEKTLALRFSESYGALKKTKPVIRENLRLYELKQVNPAIPVTGRLRPLEEKDMSFLPYWLAGFNYDCFGKTPVLEPETARYEYVLNKKNMYVLEDKETALSMAGMKRAMRSVAGVSTVYTPPYFRGRGYASSCVAALSTLILERGFTSCVLYTNLANPVSNSIYQKIGYRPVCDSVDIAF